MMPQLDSFGVLSQLRQKTSTETIPFVFITAKTAKNDRRQGMTLGADDYLVKPFTRDELFAIVTAQLKKQNVLKRQSQKKIDELHGNLIRSLPHELHTPLNGILGFSKLLIDSYDLVERDEALEMLEEIHIPELKFRKILEELIENAFKFSANETPVSVISSLKENTFTLSVIDKVEA